VPPQQFHREFLDRAGVHDIEQRQVSYTRARKFILDAVEANRKNKIKLPEDYVKYRYLVERRIIDPSPGTLAYAQQVDARTEDEWGELDGEPIRGMQVITGPDGKDIVLLDDFLGEDMEEPSFEAVLFEVEGYYSSETDDDEEPIPHNWVTHYLTTQHNKGIDPDELYDRWDNIGDFMFFLNQADDAPKSLEDIQGYHLSEFITEFWDKELTYTGPVQTTTEAKRNVIKTVQDLYLFLAQQKYISDTAAKQVSKAAATILQKEGQLTPIPK